MSDYENDEFDDEKVE